MRPPAEVLADERARLEHLGRAAGSVAHDFNNLLTVILGCGELARHCVATGEPVALEDLDALLSAGERARALSVRLLDLARQRVVAPVPLDLNALARNSEGVLRRLCGERATIALALSPQPCMVRGDPTQLEQVVLNLVVNARDATTDGGPIELSTEVLARPEGARPTVCLRVRDRGVGISPEVRARLFEPFFTTKPAGQGTGLGLATADAIVRQCGGTIEVRSASGEGTTVSVALPWLGAPRPEAPTSVDFDAPDGPHRTTVTG